MIRVGQHELEPLQHPTARDLRRPRWRCHECGLELATKLAYQDRICDWRRQRDAAVAAYVRDSGGKLPVALATAGKE